MEGKKPKLMYTGRIPVEVIYDILKYVKPDRLHRIASRSSIARWLVNGMERARYIERWLDPHKEFARNNNYYISVRNAWETKNVLENYWYFVICFNNDTYGKLLNVMGSINNKKLAISIRNTTIADVSALAGVHTLLMSYNYNVRDVTMLKDVHTLDITGCYNIHNIGINLRELCNVHTLNISYMYITDENMRICVKTLGNIHSLNMCCSNITNVMGLGGVYRLGLEECDRITNLKGIEDVHTVLLSNNNIIGDDEIGILGSVNTLGVENCRSIVNVRSLANVYSLKLEYCYYLKDVIALGNVINFRLIMCKNLDDVTMLGGLNMFNIYGCDIVDVRALGGLRALRLALCHNIKREDICVLNNIHTLNIDLCNNIMYEDIMELKGVIDLTVGSCKDFNPLCNYKWIW